MSFWCLHFPSKNERKQVDLRYHSSKVEFIRSFFGTIEYTKKSFEINWPLGQKFVKFFIIKKFYSKIIWPLVSILDQVSWRKFNAISDGLWPHYEDVCNFFYPIFTSDFFSSFLAGIRAILRLNSWEKSISAPNG